MTDLENLRSWRTGRTDRVLRLRGPGGSRGVTLIELDFGRRRVADYLTPAAAVCALAAGSVRWKVEASQSEGSCWKRETHSHANRPLGGRKRSRK